MHGVVYEDIDPSPTIADRAHGHLHRFRGSEIQRHGERLAARARDLFDNSIRLVCVFMERNSDAGSLSSEEECSRFSYATRASGDQRDAARDSEVHVSP